MNIDIFSKYVTTATAFIGMFLGIYNLWVASSSRKLKLKIIPQSINKKYNDSQMRKEVFITETDDFNETSGYFLIEVVNMSSFPVTVSQVGFKRKGSQSIHIVFPPHNKR